MRATTPPVRVFLSGDIPAVQVAEMQGEHPGAEITWFADSASFLQRIDGAEVVFGFVPEAALAQAHSLKWLHSWQAGPERQIYPSIVDHPVIITSSKGNGAIPLAEHAMMLMLMLNRNAVRWIDAQRERRWDRFMHPELNGKTVGIIGAGNSGIDLAQKARAFHMRVIGMRQSNRPAAGFDRLYRREEMHEFLSQCDFVVVTAPLTDQTRGMLGEAEFRAMKRSGFYVCSSRGGIADDSALLRALKEGWIAGAGLDAHAVEPLPPDSPFWTLANVIVTPHNGATTEETFQRAIDIFRENLRRYLAGEPLTNVVDKRLGY